MGEAPGRCTLVGEHVDYADGLVACIAVHLGVGAAVRPSADSAWRMVSEGRTVERPRGHALLAGDGADRVLAVTEALRLAGTAVPPLEIGLAATLPQGAGLASSAALSCAVLVAVLRLLGVRVRAHDVAELALVAERDVVGVPCGPLDQRAVVHAPRGGALLIDCRGAGSVKALPWPSGVRLVACDTGEAHDVGGAAYRARRTQADAALRLLGRTSWRDVDAAAVAFAEGAGVLSAPLGARARHIVAETHRAALAAQALDAGDAAALGRLMSASHASLRDDYQVSTTALDAVVAAAERVPGCLGARLVGAGFGGTAVALVEEAAVDACREAMVAAAYEGPPHIRRGRGRNPRGTGPGPPRIRGGRVRNPRVTGPRPGSWVLEPAPGVALTASDVVG